MNDKYREALLLVRRCLEELNNGIDKGINDTLWFSDHETLFDYIDSVIGPPGDLNEAAMEAAVDDLSIDVFCAAMKKRMADKRKEGAKCWHDRQQCSHGKLAGLLVVAVRKGNPVDVANYAMMLYSRGERTL